MTLEILALEMLALEIVDSVIDLEFTLRKRVIVKEHGGKAGPGGIDDDHDPAGS